MSVRTRVAKRRFKKYNPLFIGFVKQQLLPRKELFYISSSFDKIRCEIEDIINEHMKKLSNTIPVIQFTIRFGRLGEMHFRCVFRYRINALYTYDVFGASKSFTRYQRWRSGVIYYSPCLVSFLHQLAGEVTLAHQLLKPSNSRGCDIPEDEIVAVFNEMILEIKNELESRFESWR